MRLLERQIEHDFVQRMKRRGVLTVKWGRNGWPDRIVLLPGGVPVFLEFKRPGMTPRPLQSKRLDDLCTRDYWATWFDNADDAEAFVLTIAEKHGLSLGGTEC